MRMPGTSTKNRKRAAGSAPVEPAAHGTDALMSAFVALVEQKREKQEEEALQQRREEVTGRFSGLAQEVSSLGRDLSEYKIHRELRRFHFSHDLGQGAAHLLFAGFMGG